MTGFLAGLILGACIMLAWLRPRAEKIDGHPDGTHLE